MGHGAAMTLIAAIIAFLGVFVLMFWAFGPWDESADGAPFWSERK